MTTVIRSLAAFALVSCGALLSGCGGSDAAPGAGAGAEAREAIADTASPLERRPLFGDLHVHTKYSVDAFVFGTTHNGPAEAYAFGRGGTLDLGPIDPDTPVNPVRLTRPLDFMAVTDHSEGFGIYGVCQDPKSPGYSSVECQNMRGENPLPANLRFLAVGAQVLSPVPVGPVVCNRPDVDCPAYAASIWGDTQRAAAAANEPGRFTSLVAYEWTATPGNANLHRNVIFRNDKVPARAISYFDTRLPDVTKLWTQLQTACRENIPGCDALTIAHNANASLGLMYTDPKNAEEARARLAWEPLAEVTQHKGSSECRFDRKFAAGVDTTDEECAFEQIPATGLIPLAQIPEQASPPPQLFNRRAFLRSTLKDGLALQQRGLVESGNPTELTHINPFKFGFIGSTDTHNATPGATEAANWKGHAGNQEATAAKRVGDYTAIARNPGGLAVVWAERNTRGSIFAGLRRKETYGTSGTRPVVRFFGGWDFPANLCASPDIVQTGYARGVAMGSDLPARPAGAVAPRFIAWAQQDSGSPGQPGTPLQRLQIVKGWVDAGGQTHETVYDVAGSSHSRRVDPGTCSAEESGAPELCTVWQDPAFDPAQRAFYYLRVLEDPTCRWHVSQCRALGSDPFSEKCDSSSGNPNASCCADKTDPVVQQRAWASSIWYGPSP